MESLVQDVLERFYRGESLISTLAWVRSALEHLFALEGWAFFMIPSDLREQVASVPQKDVPIQVVSRLVELRVPEFILEEGKKYLSLPLRSGDMNLGAVVLIFPEKQELPDPENWVVLSSLLTMYFLRNFYLSLQNKGAVVDPLTGLYTRSYLHRRIDEERKRSLRGQTVFTLALLDLDHFLSVNKRLGPMVGDRVIQAVADMMRGHFRSTDVLCRYERDVYAILFPDTPPGNAYHALESFRKLVEETALQVEGVEDPVQITVSGGMAGFPGHALTLHELLEAAEDALQQAKTRGRNRIVVAEPHV